MMVRGGSDGDNQRATGRGDERIANPFVCFCLLVRFGGTSWEEEEEEEELGPLRG